MKLIPVSFEVNRLNNDFSLGCATRYSDTKSKEKNEKETLFIAAIIIFQGILFTRYKSKGCP